MDEEIRCPECGTRKVTREVLPGGKVIIYCKSCRLTKEMTLEQIESNQE